MRFIDVYKLTSSGAEFVTGGCIQVGEPGIQRTPIVKSFTLADGSPVVYPAQKDAAKMTLTLECNRAQAAEIEQLVHGAEIILTGIKAGALLGSGLQTADYYPAAVGVPCIITGTVDVCEKFAKSGIYGVTLPLQLLVSDQTGGAQTVSVPGLRFSALSLDGVSEVVSGSFAARYMTDRASVLGAVRACWVRKFVHFTSSPTIDITCAVADGTPTCTLYINGAAAGSSSGAAFVFEDKALAVGDNEIVLELTDTGSRTLYVVIRVYRQGVMV